MKISGFPLAALGLVLASAVVAAQPADPIELVKQARKLNLDGKQNEALALYREALSRSPDLYDAHLGVGVVLDLLGSYKEARQHFSKAIQLADDGTKNAALAAMAVSYAFESDAKDASTFYRQAFDRQ